MNPRASRRSWNEAPVRIWAILSVAVLLVAVYFTIPQIYRALKDRELINMAFRVNARNQSCGHMKDLRPALTIAATQFFPTYKLHSTSDGTSHRCAVALRN
jgi:hypothetical protein